MPKESPVRFAFLAALWAALFYSQSAAAQSMMRPGTSPDPGLKGFWRVVSAKNAPWAAPRRITKEGAPLLEYAIEFADGQVKGPAPLGCSAVQYSSGVANDGKAFGGRLSRDPSLVKKLNLWNAAPTLYRIYCGEEARDYYVSNDASLLTEEGGIVYTLVRPDGDSHQYTAGYSGPSFDCTKAKTAGEHAICADAAASKADRALAVAYAALKRSLPQSSFDTVQAAQRAWLTYVHTSCGADGPTPEGVGEVRRIAECLTTEFESRTTLLGDLKAGEKTGALVLEPHMRFRADARRHIEETGVYPVMSGGPQAVAFNEFISKTFEPGKWRMDDKEMFPDGDGDAETQSYLQRAYGMARFDGRIVSLQLKDSDEAGGRPSFSQRSYTWDLLRERPVTLNDVFVSGANWQNFVAGKCKEGLDSQIDPGQRAAITDEEIAAAVRDSTRWLWEKERATVVFMPGMWGGLPLGEIDTDIPLAELQPYMRADAPVR